MMKGLLFEKTSMLTFLFLYWCHVVRTANAAIENDTTLSYTKEELMDATQALSPWYYTNLQTKLNENQAKWRNQIHRSTATVQSYEYIYQRSCYCMKDYTRPLRIMVNIVNGKEVVASAVYNDVDTGMRHRKLQEDVTIMEDAAAAAAALAMPAMDAPLIDLPAVEDGTATVPPDNMVKPTVEELFNMIQEAIDTTSEVITVHYDSTYGYPTSVNIDYSSLIADEEDSFTASNVNIHFDTLFPTPVKEEEEEQVQQEEQLQVQLMTSTSTTSTTASETTSSTAITTTTPTTNPVFDQILHGFMLFAQQQDTTLATSLPTTTIAVSFDLNENTYIDLLELTKALITANVQAPVQGIIDFSSWLDTNQDKKLSVSELQHAIDTYSISHDLTDGTTVLNTEIIVERDANDESLTSVQVQVEQDPTLSDFTICSTLDLYQLASTLNSLLFNSNNDGDGSSSSSSTFSVTPLSLKEALVLQDATIANAAAAPTVSTTTTTTTTTTPTLQERVASTIQDTKFIQDLEQSQLLQPYDELSTSTNDKQVLLDMDNSGHIDLYELTVGLIQAGISTTPANIELLQNILNEYYHHST